MKHKNRYFLIVGFEPSVTCKETQSKENLCKELSSLTLRVFSTIAVLPPTRIPLIREIYIKLIKASLSQQPPEIPGLSGPRILLLLIYSLSIPSSAVSVNSYG